MRWVVLAMMALIIFANYYLYDCFSTLKGTLQTELGATSTQWGLIRNFYNVPNTFLFMALLGGIFLDRFGIRKTGLVFSALCAVGGVVTAYGVSDAFRSGGFGYDFMGSFLPAHSPELKMMMLGRLLFGLGAETQIVMLSKVLAKWFMGKELGLAFGLKLGGVGLGLDYRLGVFDDRPPPARTSSRPSAPCFPGWHLVNTIYNVPGSLFSKLMSYS